MITQKNPEVQPLRLLSIDRSLKVLKHPRLRVCMTSLVSNFLGKLPTSFPSLPPLSFVPAKPKRYCLTDSWSERVNSPEPTNMGDIKAELPPEEQPPSYETTTQTANIRPLRRPALPLHLPLVASLRNKRVILASASPRRKQLLAQVALNYPDATCAEAGGKQPERKGGLTSKHNLPDRTHRAGHHSIHGSRSLSQISRSV